MRLAKRKRRHVGVNRVCVAASQKLEKEGCCEKKIPIWDRAAGWLMDQPAPVSKHNTTGMAGTHLEITLAVPLYTCGRPTRSFTCVIRMWFWIGLKVCFLCRNLVSTLTALASRLFGTFAPHHPSTFTMHRPSRCQYYSSYLKAAL